MNNNNTINQVDVTKSFAAFADIIDENSINTQDNFEIKEHAAFGQFAPEEASFPRFFPV
jgi:hypothetical protein